MKTPPPQYPLELACMGVGGTSTFKVTIGTDGKPSEVALLTGAGNPQLDELAKTAVQGWQFKAATQWPAGAGHHPGAGQLQPAAAEAGPVLRH